MEGKLHINTTAVHGGGRKDDCFGAINEPIYMTSNYRIPTDGTPDQFTVRRILEITEGSLAPVACLCEPHEPCARMANCRTYPMWQGLSKLICDYLDSYTLADLMKSDDAGFDYII